MRRLTIILSLLFFASCTHHYGEPNRIVKWCPAMSPCARSIGGVQGLPSGPGAAVENAAWQNALREAQIRLYADSLWPAGKVIKAERPRIVYVSCNFVVANAISDFGQTSNECAAGKTKSNGREIWISVEEPGRVPALLVWEFRNSLFIRNGYGGWAN